MRESTLKNDLMEEAGAEVPLNACAQASQKSTTEVPRCAAALVTSRSRGIKALEKMRRLLRLNVTFALRSPVLPGLDAQFLYLWLRI